jgi:predicted aldo/keto reductase-like oxidoreductase
LGELIRERLINRKEVYISTKTKSTTIEEIEKSIDNSLILLDTHYIDILFLHSGIDSVEDYETLKRNGVFDYLIDMTSDEDPLIDYIGISGHDLDAARMAIEDGFIHVIMVPHNILYRQFEDVFKLAVEKKIGIIPIKNFASGILVGGPNNVWGDDIIKYLMAFELNTPGINLVIPSVRSIRQLEQTWGLFMQGGYEVLPKSASEFFSDIEKFIRSRLGDDVCIHCHMCRPCEKFGWEMSQPGILRLLTYNKKFGIDTREQYKKYKYNAKHCLEEDCNCSYKCPMGINIPMELFAADVILSEEDE